MPFTCHLGLSAVAESWRRWGCLKRRLLFVPAPVLCFLFLLHTIMDNESRPAAWVSFLSATVVSICCVSCLFSTKLLYLGSNLPGGDKFQEKPILIELFSECYANMSKLCGSQFCSKIGFGLHVNSSRGEKERKKNPKRWDSIFHSLEYFFWVYSFHTRAKLPFRTLSSEGHIPARVPLMEYTEGKLPTQISRRKAETGWKPNAIYRVGLRSPFWKRIEQAIFQWVQTWI